MAHLVDNFSGKSAFEEANLRGIGFTTPAEAVLTHIDRTINFPESLERSIEDLEGRWPDWCKEFGEHYRSVTGTYRWSANQSGVLVDHDTTIDLCGELGSYALPEFRPKTSFFSMTSGGFALKFGFQGLEINGKSTVRNIVSISPDVVGIVRNSIEEDSTLFEALIIRLGQIADTVSHDDIHSLTSFSPSTDTSQLPWSDFFQQFERGANAPGQNHECWVIQQHRLRFGDWKARDELAPLLDHVNESLALISQIQREVSRHLDTESARNVGKYLTTTCLFFLYQLLPLDSSHPSIHQIASTVNKMDLFDSSNGKEQEARFYENHISYAKAEFQDLLLLRKAIEIYGTETGSFDSAYSSLYSFFSSRYGYAEIFKGGYGDLTSHLGFGSGAGREKLLKKYHEIVKKRHDPRWSNTDLYMIDTFIEQGPPNINRIAEPLPKGEFRKNLELLKRLLSQEGLKMFSQYEEELDNSPGRKGKNWFDTWCYTPETPSSDYKMSNFYRIKGEIDHASKNTLDRAHKIQGFQVLHKGINDYLSVNAWIVTSQFLFLQWELSRHFEPLDLTL